VVVVVVVVKVITAVGVGRANLKGGAAADEQQLARTSSSNEQQWPQHLESLEKRLATLEEQVATLLHNSTQEKPPQKSLRRARVTIFTSLFLEVQGISPLLLVSFCLILPF